MSVRLSTISCNRLLLGISAPRVCRYLFRSGEREREKEKEKVSMWKRRKLLINYNVMEGGNGRQSMWERGREGDRKRESERVREREQEREEGESKRVSEERERERAITEKIMNFLIREGGEARRK
uniref:Uncharacterized protein n=1 Tax=Cacopsylla melanoneura TaxID=428564 RepID=A0A8D8Z8Z3_9HEMI